MVAAAGGTATVFLLDANNQRTHCLGNVVLINHDGAGVTLYGHLASIAISNGPVSQGQTIGLMGNTTGVQSSDGASCGTVGEHLHFELKDEVTLGDNGGAMWGYTPEKTRTGQPIARDAPDSFGYHNPIANLVVSAGVIETIRTVQVTPDGGGRQALIGPDSAFRPTGFTLTSGDVYNAIAMRAASTSGCARGWYQIVRQDLTYFPDTGDDAPGATEPSVWVCAGDNGVQWVQEIGACYASKELSAKTAACSSDTITITAGPAGDPNPVDSSGIVALTVSAADSLGYPLTYEWTASCAGSSSSGSFSSSTAQSPTWSAPRNPSSTSLQCTMSVAVDNGHGVTRSGTFTEVVAAEGVSSGPSGTPGDSGAPPAVNISVDPSTISEGQSAELSWGSANVTSCYGSGPSSWVGNKALTGSRSIGPASNTGTYVYTLTCQNSGGVAAQSSATLNVVSAPSPTVSITASPSTITEGQSSSLSWTSSNAATCNATGSWSGTKSQSGNQPIGPFSSSGTYVYTLDCNNGFEGHAQATATVTVSEAALPAISIAVSPSTITQGQGATVTWNSSGAANCAATDSWSGSRNPSGNQGVGPFNGTGTKTFTLVCNNGFGGESRNSTTLTIGAAAAPSVSIALNPSTVIQGQSSTISWSSTNASNCAGNGPPSWAGTRALSGSLPAGPFGSTGSQTYTLICHNDFGDQAQAAVTLTIGAAAAPTVSVEMNPSTIIQGQTSQLSWNTTNSAHCYTLDSWNGTPGTSGSQIIGPASNTGIYRYTLMCVNEFDGRAQATATLTVNPAAAPMVSVSVDPPSIVQGDYAAISWQASNAEICAATGNWSGTKNPSGNEPRGPFEDPGTRMYTLVCDNGYGTKAQASALLNVVAARGPTVSISINPSTVNQDQIATITWSSTNASSCYGSGPAAWTGDKATSGVTDVGPFAFTGTYTFMLICDNGFGDQASRSVQLNVVSSGDGSASGGGGADSANGGGTGELDLASLAALLAAAARRRRRVLGG